MRWCAGWQERSKAGRRATEGRKPLPAHLVCSRVDTKHSASVSWDGVDVAIEAQLCRGKHTEPRGHMKLMPSGPERAAETALVREGAHKLGLEGCGDAERRGEDADRRGQDEERRDEMQVEEVL